MKNLRRRSLKYEYTMNFGELDIQHETIIYENYYSMRKHYQNILGLFPCKVNGLTLCSRATLLHISVILHSHFRNVPLRNY
jgi:hypothetical protein